MIDDRAAGPEGAAQARRRPSSATVINSTIIAAAWLVGTLRIMRVGLGFDDVTYATPAQQVTLDAWRHGRMALWSNTIFGGTPHLGNVQTAALYPGHWLSAPFPDLVGPHVELSMHLLLFGVGMYLLGRRLGFAHPGPVTMAVAAMWSGATIFRTPLLIHFPPLAWTPLALLAAHAVITGTRPRQAVASLAVTLWCVLVSGHPQSVLMSFTLIGAWCAGVMIEARGWRRASLLAASGALTLLMSMPLLFALRNSMSASAASTRDTAALFGPGFFVPIRSLPRVLLGEPLSDLAFLYGQGERLTYAGVATIALALTGFTAAIAARKWSLVVVTAAGIFALSLSLGPRSPVLQFARAFLPGFDQPRVSARWNWVFVMSLILLAGAGVDRIRQGRSKAAAAVVAGCGALLALSFVLGVQHAGRDNGLLWLAIAVVVIALAFTTHTGRRLGLAATLVVLAVIELGLPMMKIIEQGHSDVTDTSQLIGPTQRWLAEQPGLTLSWITGEFDGRYVVAGLRPNANTLAGVRSIDGYDGGVAVSERWHAALLQVLPSINDFHLGGQLSYSLDPGTFARLGVRFVLYDPSRGPAAETLPGWRRVDRPGYFQVFENPFWEGNVTAWFSTARVESPAAAGNALRTSGVTLRDVGLVETKRGVLTCDVGCRPVSFVSTSEWSGQRSATVTIERDAVVTFDEQFDPGWVAEVDGRDASPIAVDGMWVGIVVPPGSHRIELRYEPEWVTPTVVVMIIGWLGVAVLLFTTRRGRVSASIENCRGRRRHRGMTESRAQR